LLTERLEIMLAPGRVRVFSSNKGWRPKPQLLADLPCVPVGDQSWQAAIAALAQWLQDTPAASRVRTGIRLSSRFVRYAMLPWSEELSGRKEEQTLAGIVYEGVYGEAAKGWRIAIAPARYGEPRLMAATDQALLTALYELFPGKRLRTVTPMLTVSLSVCHDKLPAGETQLAVIEDGALVFLGCKDRKIRSIKRLLVEPNDKVELPVLLRREALLNGYDLKTLNPCYSVQSDATSIKPAPPLVELPRSGAAALFGRGKSMPGADLGWRPGGSSGSHAGSMLLALSIAVLVGVMGRQAVMLEEAEGLQMQLDDRRARQSHAPVSPEIASARDKIEAVNARLTFPWDRLLKMLESSAGEDVALLAVEPDTANYQVKLEAEARNWAAMIDYVGKLDGEGAFSKASLVSHQINKSDPQMPVRFVVLCELEVNSAAAK
jgi:hypothetical protein